MPRTANRIEKARRESLNLKAEQISQLKRLFPEVVADGRINWEKLKAIVGESIDTSFEKFSFTWAGKVKAIRNVLVPSKATLRPDKKESVRFNESQNIFIEGDNLEVLKLLQNAYFERVKMIYIDPPYNTGNDFIYRDDFRNGIKNYLAQSGQVDEEGNRLQTNTESSGRFHSDWLNMMYPRLKLAWNLLSDDGVMFVSIDDNEVHRLRLMLDEIFGEENFIDAVIWKKRYGGGAKEKYLVSVHEYVLFFAKDKASLENIFVPTNHESIDRYYKLKDEKFETRGPYRTHPLEATKSVGVRKNLIYPIPAPDGTQIVPRRQWWWDKERTYKALKSNELEFIKGKDGWTVHTKQYLRDETGEERQSKAFSLIDNVFTQHGTAEIKALFGDSNIFPFPKPTGLIRPLIQIANAKNDDIIMDFFAGSCTTAQAALELNKEDGGDRQFIMVQLPEPIPEDSPARKAGFRTIADIGKERIRRVIKGLGKDSKPSFAGFKVFNLSRSNYPENNFEYDSELSEKENEKAYKAYLEKAGQLDLFSKASDEDLVCESIIKEGLDLNAKISELSLGKNKVFQAKDDKSEILVCLDSKIADATVKVLSSDDHKGKIFICYDKAVNDSVKANLGLRLSLRTI